MDTGQKENPVYVGGTVPSTIVNLTDKGASIHLAKTDAAIVATPEEIALIVHDAVIADGECDIHIAKINLAMLFIDVISKRADWYEYGLKLIESLKSQTQKKG